MSEQQEFCLRWNDFHSNFHVSLDALRGDESFTDVTISCSGKLLKAHRVILSACSNHFKQILKEVPPQQHPVIVLPTVDHEVMRAILQFIYQGQVNVRQVQLGAFLQVAETFSIQGLADDDSKKQSQDPPRPRPADSAPSPCTPAAKRSRVEPTAVPVPVSVPVSVSVPTGPLAAPLSPGHTADVDVNIKSESVSEMSDELGDLLEPVVGGLQRHALDSSVDSDAQPVLALQHHDGGTSQASRDDVAAAAAMMMARPGAPVRSLMREYFSGDGQDRFCRMCGLTVRLNRQLSTSGLWRHMRVKHPQMVSQPPAPAAADWAQLVSDAAPAMADTAAPHWLLKQHQASSSGPC